MDVSGKHGEKRRFLKDRYGFDAICAFLLWISVLIDLLVLLLPYEEIRPFCWISFIPLLFCVLRIFSRDCDRREMENDLFTGIFDPFKDAANQRRERKYQKKMFRFFRCPSCRQQLRVPRGKGKVEITCPSCGSKFIRKA